MTEPYSTEGWLPLHREASLVNQLLGAGATAIRRANYADGRGQYYVAFFTLSTGLERLSKLILVADFAIKNDGSLPTQDKLKRFGHNLVSLLSAVEHTIKDNQLDLNYCRPSDDISKAIVGCLQSFANAKQGRYANFNALSNPEYDTNLEPMRKWWIDVGETILEKHFRGKRAENKVRTNARVIDQMIGSFTMVMHSNEIGDSMTDVETASVRTGETEYVQRYGQFYVLSLIRWLSETWCQLVRLAHYQKGYSVFSGHHEFFWPYTNDDRYLKSRKTWPA